MRTLAVLVVILGLAAAVLWLTATPPAERQPTSDADPTGAISGRVSRHGYPVVARLEAKRIRDISPREGEEREEWHFLWRMGEPPAGSGVPVGTADSDEDGSFRIEGLPPAEYHVTAETSDGAVGQWKLKVGASGQIVRVALDICDTDHTLEGRIQWSDGRPFRGLVSAGPRGTETSPDGRFVLTDLPSHPFPIEVYEQDMISRTVGYLAADVSTEIAIVVDDGLVALEGRVVTESDGEPVAGATVHTAGRDGPGRNCATVTRTRPDGTFSLLGHPDWGLAAGGDGFITEWVKSAEPGDPVEFRLRPRPVVSGRVVAADDGRPVRGAAVWLVGLPDHDDDSMYQHWRTPILSDEEGRFRFTTSLTGSAMVVVHGRGYLSSALPVASADGYNPLAIDLSGGRLDELQLVVVPSPSIAGRVTDHTGDPVAGLRIHADDTARFLLGGRSTGWKDERPTAVTGPDGTYEIPTVFPGILWTITIYPPVGFPVESDPIRPDGRATVDLTLPRPPCRWVEVEVLSAADSRPIASAWVTVEPETDPEEQGDDLLTWYGGQGATGPDGRTLVGPLPAGPLVVRISHREHPSRSDIPVPGSEGDRDRMNLTVRLQPGAVLAGRVLMPDGTPAAFANLRVSSGHRFLTEKRSAASGQFAFRNLRGGTYRISASRFGADRTPFFAEQEAATDREDLVLTLEAVPPGQRTPRDDPRAGPPGEGRISGRVLDPSGVPVRGARVRVRPPNDPERFPRSAARTVVWTDADGRFAFTGIGVGPHVLGAVGPPHLCLRDAVSASPGDEDVVIRLTKAAEPVVTVLDAAGTPIPGMLVHLHVPGEDRRKYSWKAFRSDVTDARGRVSFGGLDPERALLLALESPDDRDDLPEMEIEDWLPADRTIRLPGVRTLRGVVRDRDGFAVGYASVWCRPVGEENAEWEEIHVGSDGSFEAEEVPSGALELRAGGYDADLDDPGLVAKEVEPGVDRVEFEIDGGRWIGLQVPDWPADEEVRVSLAWPGGVRCLDMPSDGRVRFHQVPKAPWYSIYAGPLPGGRLAYRRGLTVGKDNTVPLAVGKSVSGLILAPEKVSGAYVSIHSRSLLLTALDPRECVSERYRVEGLPDGEYSVHINARAGLRKYRGEVRVKAGETADVKLLPLEK